jgi:hypothetical protein
MTSDRPVPDNRAYQDLTVDIPGFMVSFGGYLKERHERAAVPAQFGPCGFRLVICGIKGRGRSVDWEPIGSVIVTQADHDGVEWVHASIARRKMPDYADLVALKEATWGPDGYAYQVFAGAAEHVNIHERALHLWGRADGARALPAFGQWGTI